MNSLKQLLFHKFATEARERLLAELKQTYEPKKGDRFHHQGVTYEIGSLVVSGNGLEYEISSKIPLEELGGSEDIQAFFEEIKNQCYNCTRPPVHMGMDDIVSKTGEREIKKRDYIRLRHNYEFDELFDERQVAAQMEAIQQGQQDLPPQINGVITVSGRVVLMDVRENTYRYIKENTMQFIETNEKVREKFRQRSKTA